MRISAWNIEGRLSRFAETDRRGSPEHILRGISELGSDIVILPEACDGAKSIEPEVLSRIESELGYKIFSTEYQEKGERRFAAVKSPCMMLLSRKEVVIHDSIRPGNIRTMIKADISDDKSDQAIRVLGIHLDDRNEAGRLSQVNDLISEISNSPYPIVVMGDFNAMYKGSLPARFYRSRLMKIIIALAPSKLKDILQRLSGMATGETLERLLSDSDLSDADPDGRLTATPKMRGQEWMPSIRMAQIDHIFTSSQIIVRNFKVEGDGGSDHRAISVDISLPIQN